jgi:calcineurin-like phosphoesterase family protein|tara:strand:- start:28 stop:492 length:465 start_codon:yes stop_codon:yes gene_type:complete
MALKRGFKNIEEHDEHFITQWNSVVSKRDTTYILGDVTMEKSAPYHLLDRLNGIKHVVMGNHERRQDVRKLLEHVDSVSGMVSYKGLILTHCPIHPMELDDRYHKNIHGHIHEKQVMLDMWTNIPDNRYICVSCERVDFTPKTLEELGIKRSPR